MRLLREYQTELTAYTRGRGRIQLRVSGYRPCREQEQIVKELGYDPARDLENPASSVFCAHGAGYEVKWQDVDAAAHLPLLRLGGPARQEPQRIVKSVAPGARRNWKRSCWRSLSAPTARFAAAMCCRR